LESIKAVKLDVGQFLADSIGSITFKDSNRGFFFDSTKGEALAPCLQVSGHSAGTGAALIVYGYGLTPPDDQCFCDLKDSIDDCCCSIEDVNRLNLSTWL